MQRIVLPGDIEVVVASYGGVGTTFLLRFLSKYRKTNDPDDADGFKHSVLPQVSTNPDLKFLYVYGNPQLAAISLFRRNYHHEQSEKLQKWNNNPGSPIPRNMTLEEYASLGVDKFHFRQNFYNWYEKYLSKHPTMFIRYENIFDNVESIINFLGLPAESINDFPENKGRNSSLDSIPKKTLVDLDSIYKEFSNELEKLNDVEIRVEKDQAKYRSKLISGSYRRAFLEQGCYGIKECVKKFTPNVYTKIRKKIIK